MEAGSFSQKFQCKLRSAECPASCPQVFQGVSTEAATLVVGEQRDGGRNAYMQLLVVASYRNTCKAAMCYVDPTYGGASIIVWGNLSHQGVRKTLNNFHVRDCSNFGGVFSKLYSSIEAGSHGPSSWKEHWELDQDAGEDYMEKVFSGGATEGQSSTSRKARKKKSKNR